MKIHHRHRARLAARFAAAALALPLLGQQGPCPSPAPNEGPVMKVTVPAGVRLDKAGPAAVIEGSLVRGAFDGSGRPVARPGASVRFSIDRAWKERTPGPRKSILSWILRPLDFPARTLRIAASWATVDGGQKMAVSVLRVSKGRKGQRIVWLRPTAAEALTPPASEHARTHGPITIPAGTRLRAALLDPLHSSLSANGDAVRAMLTEPVEAPGDGSGGGAVVLLPAGTMLTGKVTRAAGARWLSRPGKLGLAFQQISAPCGATAEFSATLSGLDKEEAAPWQIDREGGISGGPQGKLKLLLHIGSSYAIGKLVDDIMEEGLKAAAGAAAGTAATAARYPSMGLGVFLFAMQKGREVSLPAFQEVEITLSRPVELK